MRRRLPDLGIALAPQPPASPLSITGFRAWRIKEPVSARRYTVVRLQSQGGDVGYGEGGPVPGNEIAEARAAVVGRRAHETEFIRARLAAIPAMEAAVTNAMLDLLSTVHGKFQSTSSSAAPRALRRACWRNSKAMTRRPWPRPRPARNGRASAPSRCRCRSAIP